MHDLTAVAEINDPEERARAAAAVIADLDAQAAQAQTIATEAAWAMLDAGKRPADVARALGISRSAVAQRFRQDRRTA